jgi:cob(I)alamin adenosyltransferase
MKGQTYSELSAMEYFENLRIVQYGDLHFIHDKPDESDIALARNGLAEIKEAMVSGKYDLVIFDEVNTAVFFGAIAEDEVIEVLNVKPEHVEVVLTGRGAPEGFIRIADLVTEMRAIKHYYYKGIGARLGIEH